MLRVWLPAIAVLLAATGAREPETSTYLDVRAPMRDGVTLSTNVFLPPVKGRAPVILVRTPYGKGRELARYYRGFLERGYALVIQDVRGRYLSEGRFDPLRQETADTEDTLNWIAAQPWSNQRIGMIGGSYLGIVQWKAALLRNPYLKAIFPVVSGADDYFDRFYSRGGALKLGQRMVWMSENVRIRGWRPSYRSFIFHTPLRNMDWLATGRRVEFYQQALNHPDYDGFWRDVSTRERLERITTPVFSVGGWYDNFVQSDLEAFAIMRRNSRVHRILIGPWAHNMSVPFTGVDFGPEAVAPVRRLQLEWFDHWLKGSKGPSPAAGPPLRLFVMGANRWRDENEWPLARARTVSYYLSSKGKANGLAGDGRLETRRRRTEPPDLFVYNPRSPVPTRGGGICCNQKLLPPGPLDQRAIEGRDDVLVYTSEPLKRDVEATGPVAAELHVATSALDTDFTAKLVDVFPDGEARILTDGILRLRYRVSLAEPELAEPGRVYKIAIDAGVTSNVFRKGHRIRLEVSSSNFPRFDRNPNTGRSIADEREYRPANQTVYHDAARPSRLLLPVIDESRGR